jgi:hypothetical protein
MWPTNGSRYRLHAGEGSLEEALGFSRPFDVNLERLARVANELARVPTVGVELKVSLAVCTVENAYTACHEVMDPLTVLSHHLKLLHACHDETLLQRTTDRYWG